MKHLSGPELVVEIVSSYHELALLRNGRVQIPCNVDPKHLMAFLEQNSNKAQLISESIKRKEVSAFCLKVINYNHFYC